MELSLQYQSPNPGKLPDRWLRCPKMADSLIQSKFLTFKTPLSETFDSKVSMEERFHPKQVFQDNRNKFSGKIGLWIDLTNTNRFYNEKEIEKRDCYYVKMFCRGFGVSPSLEQTRYFIDTVDKFVTMNPYDIIAVHCTHGFNRTG